MPTLPFRGLSEKGVLHDPSPYQLDLNAWSHAQNMRFHANQAERSPIFRGVQSTAWTPKFALGRRAGSGFDTVILVDTNGRLYSFDAGVITEVSPAGYANAVTGSATVASMLGSVLYINQPNQQPYYLGPGMTQFATLPGWNSAWAARSLRAFGDYMVALNVTKSGVNTPQLVKTSDLTLAGLPPDSWDQTDLTKSATENPLEQLTTPLVDGLPMRSINVLYTSDQIWGMQLSGDQFIFDYYRLFGNGGLLAPNCVAEVDGRHYCFGVDDIYVHDGVTKLSIIDKRNRDYVYRMLNRNMTEVCFVSYLPALNTICFGYNTGSMDAAFQGGSYCNFAGMYDLKSDTWSFIDLPNVSSLSIANLANTLTYADAGTLLDGTVGGTSFDLTNSLAANVIGASAMGDSGGLIQANRLVAYDFLTRGTLTFPMAADANAPAILERVGIDLDQTGADLGSYKTIRRIFPLVQLYNDVPIDVTVGSSVLPGGPITWLQPVSFDPSMQYKVDIRKGGRYLALRFTTGVQADFGVSGFDADITNGGHR